MVLQTVTVSVLFSAPLAETEVSNQTNLRNFLFVYVRHPPFLLRPNKNKVNLDSSLSLVNRIQGAIQGILCARLLFHIHFVNELPEGNHLSQISSFRAAIEMTPSKPANVAETEFWLTEGGVRS